MKKEFIALAVVLAILTFSIINAAYVRGCAEEFSADIQNAQRIYDSGDAEKAADAVSDSLSGWLQWHKYAHIMLRHSEVDDVTESYYELLADLQNSDDKVTPASFGMVEQKLRNIADMEQMTIGSIL